MKHIAIIMAVILGITPGIATIPASADQFVEPAHTRVVPEKRFHKEPLLLKESLRNNIEEVNFTIRIFLWSLGQGETGIVKKSLSKRIKYRFNNDRSLVYALNIAHRPMHHAKSIFLHEPEFLNDHVVQSVYVIDGSGKYWKATYMLERNHQNRFTISDFEFIRLKGAFS